MLVLDSFDWRICFGKVTSWYDWSTVFLLFKILRQSTWNWLQWHLKYKVFPVLNNAFNYPKICVPSKSDLYPQMLNPRGTCTPKSKCEWECCFTPTKKDWEYQISSCHQFQHSLQQTDHDFLEKKRAYNTWIISSEEEVGITVKPIYVTCFIHNTGQSR